MEEQEKQEEKVVLDGKEVTREQLNEAKENSKTPIAEKQDGSFVTLQKLRG